MKKILIALDYAPTAQRVAETGYLLAKSMNAEVTLLHVVTERLYYSATVTSPMMGFDNYMLTDLLQSDEATKKAAQQFLEKSKKHLRDEAIQTLIVEGNVADSILEVAKDKHIDIIVMGSHSQRWLEKILMGSVTEKVLHHNAYPLFIIPTKKLD